MSVVAEFVASEVVAVAVTVVCSQVVVLISVRVVLVAVVSSGLVAVSAGLVCVEEIDVSAAVVLLKPLVVDEVTVDPADSDVVAASVAVLVAVVAVAASLDGVMPVGPEVEEGPSVALVI